VLERDAGTLEGAGSRAAIAAELRAGAYNYQPLPVVLARGKGTQVWDVEGREYVDCMAGYGAVNHGHGHPRLIAAMKRQLDELYLVGRAFYNDQLGAYEEAVTSHFGFERLLPTNTGVEAGETAVKLARRWAYDVKGVPADCARVAFPEGNFWGRTLAAVSSSTDPSAYGGFGPLAPGFDIVPYDDLPALEAHFKAHPHTCAYFFEPLQGEGGVVVPQEGYLRGVRELCDRFNVLMICDEVQAGMGRTGHDAAVWREAGVQPDLLLLAKSLSGGLYPVSCVLGSSEVLLSVAPGEHGSTFGGNPLGCAVALEGLAVLKEERLSENAQEMGEIFRAGLREVAAAHPGAVADVRGLGLMNALELSPEAPAAAWDVCLEMRDRGLLARPTKEHILRFTPPLVIDRAGVNRCVEIVADSLRARLA
jgi:ornithine--oxo-acid transaminase